MSKIKLGVVGYGNMGTTHVNNVMTGKVPQMEIAAVCDTDPERLKVLNEKFPYIPRWTKESVLNITV